MNLDRQDLMLILNLLDEEFEKVRYADLTAYKVNLVDLIERVAKELNDMEDI